MSDLAKRLRIKAGMIEMGERIAWGSDTALMREAADALESTARGAREAYKLVPVEPTPEMVSAAEDAHMPFGDMDLAVRMAILDAPAVQGEPGVKWAPEEVANGNKGIRWVSDEGVHGRPTDHDCRVYLESNPNARGCHCPEFTKLYTAPQPAPDVKALVVTLKSIEEWVMRYADPKHPVATVARKALADYRKQGGGV